MAGPSLKEQLDELLGKLNPGTIVGVDIGSHSIKVCELAGSPGKLRLERFGVFTLSEAALIEDEVQKPSEVSDGILEAFNQARIKSRTVCLGLFGPNTMTKRLNVPEGTAEEVEDHVMWEAEQYITFGADDSQIDFDIVGENEGGGKDAIVAAAKNDLIDSFTELLKSAKIQVKVVDLNVLALSNVFEQVAGGNIEEYSQGTLLLDFGAQTTKIVVFKRGGPIFTKEIPVGGGLITEEIQRQMGVSYEEAEDLKTTTDENGNLPEEILNIINIQIEKQMSDVRKNINFYISQGSAERVSHCFVTGGGSLLPGLLEKLTEVSGLPVERLDVFSAVKVDEKKIGHNLEQLAAISPVVIGLAMRKFS
ncbi:type IV pilus assembly protein PilM [Peredibacter starrii]|uniref:Type IV pilus assembly protein PilM n=1 Tax=Peredibacter starrii TaxID=28202 RepID=A0AAX4HR21_9BACT|nr:type IV pilus assembly protein PilM [Peredibacter starrii]WPU65536.1 type IV pilus assembly protein PilM [Peredibacter starrii]